MDLKRKIRASGVRQWMIAEAIGVTEFTFSRWLRHPERLDRDTILKIENAIIELGDGDNEKAVGNQ